MIIIDNQPNFSSKLAATTLSSRSQATVSYLQNICQQEYLRYELLLHRNFCGWNEPKRAYMICFSRIWSLSSCQNYSLRFSNQYVNRRFPTCIFCTRLSNIVFSYWKRKPDSRILSKSAYLYESFWRTNWILFKRTFLIGNRDLNQKISFCRTSFNDKVPPKTHSIVMFMDPSGQNLDMSFFFKNEPAFLKNQWLHFFHRAISQLFYYL